jgi:tRNA G10  N-methylase Trm11
MHVPDGAFIADITYNKGVFWKKIKRQQDNMFLNYTVISSDISGYKVDIRCDCRMLPYHDNTFDAVFFDPPWANLSTTPRKDFLGEQYNLLSIKTLKELYELYYSGIKESCRVLKNKGVLVVKCQDMVNSGKKHWISCDLKEYAELNSFITLDRKTQINLRSVSCPQKQQHFRSNESCYWIFRKEAK